jgi:hypothetical protein
MVSEIQKKKFGSGNGFENLLFFKNHFFKKIYFRGGVRVSVSGNLRSRSDPRIAKRVTRCNFWELK